MALSKAKLQDSDLTESRAAINTSQKRGIRLLADKNRRPLSALFVFVVMMLIFTIANPGMFLSPSIYGTIFESLPIRIILVIPLVFVIAAGETDLSFAATLRVSTWVFAAMIVAGWNPFLSAVLAIAAGAGIGLLNGLIVTRIGLSSLVTTLGMAFLLEGLVSGGSKGNVISLPFLKDTAIHKVFAGSLGGFPIQMIWGLLVAGIGLILFNAHRFGARICCVGDNLESAQEMGINVTRVKTLAFVYVGLSAGMAGVLSTLIYGSFWPGAGAPFEMVLIVLASVFIGGTPTWGGIGTVAGAIFGACTVRFIETGIIAAGLTGFYTQLCNGVIIILALLGHKLNEPRYRF